MSTSVENERRGSLRDSLDCSVCKKAFTETKKIIQCGRCNENFCINCSGLTQTKVTIFKEVANGVVWFCGNCQEPAIKSVKTDKEIEERCKIYWEKMEQRMNALEKKINHKAEKFELVKLTAAVSELREDISKKPGKDEFDKIKNKLDNLQLQEADQNDQIQAAVQKEVLEWREIEKRKSNIMVYGIPEETTGKSGTDTDRLKMEAIITEELGVHDVKVKKIYRVGKRKATEQTATVNVEDQARVKNRPLKVIFSSPFEKTKVVTSYWEKKGNDETFDFGISSDFTKYENDKYQKLKAELKAREERGETNLCIRNLKIVKRK